MDFWRRSARKSMRRKKRNTVIREEIKEKKDVVENIEEKKIMLGHTERMEEGGLPKA